MSDIHNLPRKRIGAGIVIVDPLDRLLLVQPIYKTRWELPGEMVEAGESTRNAVVREAEEELGIKIVIDRLLLVD